MKRALCILSAFLFIAAAVGAQENAEGTALTKAGVKDPVKQQVMDLNKASSDRIGLLRADLKVKEAELSKLLIQDKYDLQAVEKTLKEVSAIEVQIRMERIKTELAVRDLIGKDSWAKVRKLLRERLTPHPGKSDKQAKKKSK